MRKVVFTFKPESKDQYMTLLYAVAAALAVSAMSAIGILFLFKKDELHGRKVHSLLALAAGAMLGNALLHLVPHALTLETRAIENHTPPAIVEIFSGHDHGHETKVDAPKNFAPHLEDYIKQHHDHAGHDHGDHAGHDHGDHAGHDHGDHAGHDHGDHAGHDHDSHAGHDHDSPAGHDHDSHAGHDHDSPAGHDHDSHAGHGHTGLFTCLMIMFGLGAFATFDLWLMGRSFHKHGVSSEGFMVVAADMVENLLDGVVIGTAFLLSPAAGLAATIAIMLHEIPLELGDFAVMRHSGFSQRTALVLNISSGLTSVVGALFAVLIGTSLEGFALYATPIAAGGFLYIAASIIIPKLREQKEGTARYMLMSAIGVAVMVAILFFE
ncbi:MAG: hypothetical protein GC193_10765 [Cryomorphaceae bacterium]|nr:hypothetical protein [Cryomorphaceae bacterium]